MKKYSLIIPEVPPKEIRGNSRAHWRTVRKINRERREQGRLLILELMEGNDVKTIPDRVLISYEFYHWKPIDLDNLIFGMKSTLDGIVDSGIVLDDAPHLAKIEAEFFKEKKKDNNSRTIITISEIVE
jgi:Holliday junction resolvase RusA-like endonuclease